MIELLSIAHPVPFVRLLARGALRVGMSRPPSVSPANGSAHGLAGSRFVKTTPYLR
jgi:hypothetical protein